MPVHDRFLTAAEVAEHLGVTRQTVYNLMAQGLPSLKVGRCRRFRLAEVDAWLDQVNQKEPRWLNL